MKRLILSLLIIIASLFVIDRVGGRVMWWVNQNTKDIAGPKIRYLANDVKEDVVLLGTSRSNFHYVPSILSDSLGLSVFNGGIDGSGGIYSHYILLNLMLEHHTPKMVCLEVMNSTFQKEDNPFELISFFAPYIGRSERADSVFREAGNYWTYRISHLYRYNAKAMSNLAGLIVNKQTGNDHGYIPMLDPKSYPELVPGAPGGNVDSLKIKYLHKFIDICKERDIKLVMTVSPAFSTADRGVYDILRDIAEANNVPFFDYHGKGLFLDHPEYFKDNSHLWDKGARIYTSIFAHDLKKALHKNAIMEKVKAETQKIQVP